MVSGQRTRVEFDMLVGSACESDQQGEFTAYYLSNGLECGFNNFGGSACDLTDRP